MQSTNRKNITNEEFVGAWQSSETLAEVQQKTSLAIPSIRARRSILCRLGVNLKSIGRSRRGNDIDVARLNNVATQTLATYVPPT